MEFESKTVIRIIESCFDTFQFERAFVALEGETAEPHAIISGVECMLGTKPTLLDAGIVYCAPLDPILQANWPVYCDLEIDGFTDRHWNLTADSATVAAARHFAEMEAADTLRIGMEL